MDKKTIARFIVFILAWANSFLAAHHYKTFPVVDDTQVALWITFAISAFEWMKHSWKWIQTNWVKKQPGPSIPADVNSVPTPTAVDTSIPAAPSVVQAQTIESTTKPE
jgi:SPP1 family holin